MYILVAVVVIIIIVAAVVAYVYLYQPSGEGGGGGGGGGETVYTISNATSLSFDVNLTIAGSLGTYTFQGKDLQSHDLMLRVDTQPDTAVDTTYSYIFFAGNETAYSATDNGAWTESSDFQTDWTTWSTQFFGYVNHDATWVSGDGDQSYTDSTLGGDVVISNIQINPTLADSIFTPTT
jgi:hypothetical protein